MSDFNRFQRGVLENFNSEDADQSVAQFTSFQEVEEYGDPVLAGLIQLLDSHEDCHTVEDAQQRIDRVMGMVMDARFAIDAVAAAEGAPEPGQSGRTFRRHCFVFEVLSEEPVGSLSLSEYDYQTSEGHCVGRFLFTHESPLSGPQAARALEAAGSDAGFFNLNPDGSDEDEV